MTISKKERKAAMEMSLSDHFTLWEMLNSDSFPALVELPSDEIIERGAEFAHKVLEPFRERCNNGNPLRVMSWYRNPALNAAVGGVTHSIHQIYLSRLLGVAADVAPQSLFEAYSKIPDAGISALRTAIIYPDRSFIHLDSNADKATCGYFIKWKSSKQYHPISAQQAADIKTTILHMFGVKV